MANLVTGKDKIIKQVKLSLVTDNDPNNKRPKLEWKVEQTEYDQFTVEPDMLNDGSRFIVMNNGEEILVGYYSCIAAFEAYKDYGIELEKVIFEHMREMLGFKRKF